MANCGLVRIPILCLLVFSLICGSLGDSAYTGRVPNSGRIPDPCPPNYKWVRIGEGTDGGSRDPFEMDFNAHNEQWTAALCNGDTDGDGRTNGEELGDPSCEWLPGNFDTNAQITHPGICDPLTSAGCKARNIWGFCQEQEFICPAINTGDVRSIKFEFPLTEVPAQESSYRCMSFSIRTEAEFAVIASKPEIYNHDVLHHILVYACTDDANPLNAVPGSCDNGIMNNCIKLIGIWKAGLQGECLDNNIGFNVGKFNRVTLQVHWLNPLLADDITDAPGMTMYYVPSNPSRKDASRLMLGQAYLDIPYGKSMYEETSVCKSFSTNGEVKFTAAVNHMLSTGVSAKIEQFRDGNIVRTFAVDEYYSSATPQQHTFSQHIDFKSGDELKLYCAYNTEGHDTAIYQGSHEWEEQCFSFLTYYPADNLLATACTQWRDVDVYDLGSEQANCVYTNFYDATNKATLAIRAHVLSRCYPFECREGCAEMVAKVRAQNPCLQGNMADFAAYANRGDREWLDFHVALRSCDNTCDAE